MKNIIIEGFNIGLSKNITGIQRYAREIIYRIDFLLESSDFKVYYLYNPDYPNVVINPLNLKNIIPIPLKKKKHFSLINKFIDHLKIAKKYNAIICSLALDTLINKNQISCIHDMRPIYFKSDSFKFRLQYKIYLWIQKHFTKVILTVSEFSKKQIMDYFHIKDQSIVKVIYNGYEHMIDIMPDYTIFDRYPMLKEKEYYYSLGSLAPHKNFNWVINQAKFNPDKLYVVGGGKVSIWKDNISEDNISNLLFLGYVNDEENKALMMKCRAFLHPSKYEGFGVPPLEALYCGVPLVISKATCLPEIYEDCAHYFDPDDYLYDIELHLNESVGDPQKILKKCNWDKSAQDLYEIFVKNVNE